MDTAQPTPETIAAWRDAASAPRMAGLADLDACVDVFTRAFADDPVTVWYLRGGRQRAGALRRSMAGVLGGWILAEGHTWLAADGGACAAFLPPDPAPPGRALGEWLRLLRRVQPHTGWWRLQRLMRLIVAMDRNHPHGAPHYYLWMIGVDPVRAGHGVGTALLRAGLERYDREGVATYLENSNPRNAGFYARLGYVPRGVYRPVGGGPPMEAMWREPGG